MTLFHPPFSSVLICAMCVEFAVDAFDVGDFLEQAFNDCGGGVVGVDQHGKVFLLPRWAGFGCHASSLNRVGSTLLRIGGNAPRFAHWLLVLGVCPPLCVVANG